MASPRPRGGRAPVLALAATVVAAFVLLAGLAAAAPVPRILSDELRYTIAADSLAGGDGLELRAEAYGFGPVYPAILAAIVSFAPDREVAYPLFKVANALLFALAAVPVYLVARRLLPPWWSLGVVGLSLAIPSSVYVSLVLTESASYLAAWLAILAVVLALERPSVPRQLAVLGAVGLAFLTRAQFAALYAAYVAALLFLWAVVPARRPRDRTGLRKLWPTLGALAIGLAVLVAGPLVSGTSPAGSPDAYDGLWREYDLLDVGRWFVYHLAALELYVAVVPLAVAPIVLTRLLRDARTGSAPEGAFVSAFLAINAFLLLVAAAFSSLPVGLDHLHDRYLFYVAPFWFVVVAVWLHDGLPRPVLATVLGAGIALALPTVIPFSQLAAEELADVDAIVTHPWAAINDAAVDLSPDDLSGRRVLAVVVVALVAATAFLPRRFGALLASAVAALVLIGTAITWKDSLEAARDLEDVLPNDRAWVDDAVATTAAVTSLHVAAPCLRERRTVEGRLLTEFFNRRVRRAAHVSLRDGSLLPSTDVRIASDGAVVREPGGSYDAEYVLAPPGMTLHGRRVATGTTVPLVLWRVDGPVRLSRARSSGELPRLICAAGS